jgi:putative sigma-54 modulation protein
MKLTTTARHFEASPELLEYTEKRLRRLKRFFDHILNVQVIMSVEKFRNFAEVNIHVNGHNFTAKEVSDDMRTSVDQAAKSLERQMKKFKGKMIANHHKAKKGEVRAMPAEMIFRSESIGKGEELELIEQVPRNIPVFSVEEAIIRMEDEEGSFLLFKNMESGNLNLVYKRSDGHYGVVDTTQVEKG